jgi:hypothetical protein
MVLLVYSSKSLYRETIAIPSPLEPLLSSLLVQCTLTPLSDWVSRVSPLSCPIHLTSQNYLLSSLFTPRYVRLRDVEHRDLRGFVCF